MDRNDVMAKMAKFFDKDVSILNDSDELKSHVQDSFLLVELVMTLQEDLGVRIMQEDLKDVTTVGGLADTFLAKANS